MLVPILKEIIMQAMRYISMKNEVIFYIERVKIKVHTQSIFMKTFTF